MLKWKKSESTVIPETIDTISSKTTVYIRRNIKEVSRTDEMSGKDVIFYKYEEAKLTHAEYQKYLQMVEAVNMRQMRADLDYISLCTGINLEV